MRLISVVGARPSLVKVAPLLPHLAKAGIDVDIAYTGTRCTPRPATRPPKKMSFYGVEVPTPRWFIDVGAHSDTARTGRATTELERLFLEERPDAVLVVGDGDTTLAAAVSAAKAGIRVIHLEAGLRSGDLAESGEVNRVLISRVAAMHLAPTEEALGNLEDEGVDPERIYFVGSMLAEAVLQQLEGLGPVKTCADHGVRPGSYILTSIHSAEVLEHDWRLHGLMEGLARTRWPVLVPDPGGLRKALSIHGVPIPDNVHVIDAVSYPEMLALERDALAVVTDSSGVQEEACILRTPCVTYRDSTERRATVACGSNRLAGSSPEGLVRRLDEAVADAPRWSVPQRWDRAVSDRVVRAIVRGAEPLH